jgi:hypothetical protein
LINVEQYYFLVHRSSFIVQKVACVLAETFALQHITIVCYPLRDRRFMRKLSGGALRDHRLSADTPPALKRGPEEQRIY